MELCSLSAGWLFRALLLLLLPSLFPACSEEWPVVNLTLGQVRGRCVDQPDAQLKKFYQFEGIPYALPPTGERRFQDPQELEGWDGIRNATAPGSVCVQRRSSSREMLGEEDCLFINVYTAKSPQTWAETKQPVAVWIHSGSFVSSWGHMDVLRPDTLLREGLVIVSFNFRLGALGFLNTEDSQAPGNAGLKDAVMALRWVQRNIAAFGGDPGKVMVFGSGSAAAIVHYLLLTPLTQGLLHVALSLSGTANTVWAYANSPRSHAVALREHFNASCADLPAGAIVPCLQRAPAAELVANQNRAHPQETELARWPNPFLPSAEAPGSSAAPFLRAAPEQLMREGRFLRVPFVTGVTSGEGIFYLWLRRLMSEPARWAAMDDDLEGEFFEHLHPSIRSREAARRMRRFYLGDRSLRNATRDPDTMRRFIQMVSDIFVVLPSVSAAQLMAQGGSTVFFYESTYESPAPFLKTHHYNASWVAGVAHGEDTAYLFERAHSDQSAPPEPPGDGAVRARCARMFFNLANSGAPTTPESGFSWSPYTPENEKFLDIGAQFAERTHLLGERAAFWRRLARCEPPGVCAQRPAARVREGLLRGRRAASAAGCHYYSFLGVPYAKPPLGPLRFKDPEQPEPWQGVRDALREGNQCVQAPDLRVPSVSEGDEDCLFVNVYTPQLPAWIMGTLPVLVWIHGGGFVSGSGAIGPDYLVCEDVIVVSINYRLGVLGFLYMEEAAPGNAGLKDQVQALRWVSGNIAAFGGSPGRVTLAGASAGGASAHLHLLSPLSKGLFQRAVAQSGSALSPWAVQHEPLQTSLRLAAAAGCDASAAPPAVVGCLRGVPAPRLIEAALTHALGPRDQGRIVKFPFVPTKDLPVAGVETFLPKTASEMVEQGLHHAVPFLTGFNKMESIIHILFMNFRNATVANLIDNSWDTAILPELGLDSNSTQVQEALAACRRFYMNGRPLSNDTFLGFMNFLSDSSTAIYEVLRHMSSARKAPIYLYSFEIDDNLNALKVKFNVSDIPGAAHADEMGYLFRIPGLPDVPQNSSASLARRRMVRMWTNYVKTGNPTPDADPLLGMRWEKYTEQVRNFLVIGAELRAAVGLNSARAAFWEEFYRTYGG